MVGAGPAGMRAAITLADMGHEVTLFDSAPLGGRLVAATRLDLKQDLRALLAHLVHEVRRRPISLVEADATIENLRKEGFDRVVLATGRRSLTLSFAPQWTSSVPKVDRIGPGEAAVVIGGGMVGCDAALQLARNGVKVTLVEKTTRLLSDTDVFTDQSGVPVKLQEEGVTIMTGTEAIAGGDGYVVVRNSEGVEQRLTARSVVAAVGHEPARDLHDELRAQLPDLPLELVGTVRAGERVMDALHDAFFAMRRYN